MKSDIDEVALQGIEFWSNVCDEEMDLAIEASEVSWGLMWWELLFWLGFGTYLFGGCYFSPLGELYSDWG